MPQIIVDAAAGDVSAELARRGIPRGARVHVVVELVENETLPMARIAQDGKALDWLRDEPDLYSDDDLIEARR
ncbi:hypothetical protein HVPorG_04171 (plasmid) [Roseomonas mucosa]|uniref:hypothetical protein n=1 Tax=Roseomonas mucosa TaxID=207340 RepID=UPI0022014367|nr:hypothetical protein [Roseomonas mucosa]QDJ12245.1 hypothetical protein HVPorG_04171 [Roseomonas mucosa]